MSYLEAEFYCYVGNYVARNNEQIIFLFIIAIIAGVVFHYLTQGGD